MTSDSLASVHVMGDHWLPDFTGLSMSGRLVNRAKDLSDPAAEERLCAMFQSFVEQQPPLLGHPSRGGAATIVIAVPPNPSVDDHLAPKLAAAAATALGLVIDHELLIRRHPTRRMRDTEPSLRHAVAELAGYEVTRPLVGASILLVDDVVMTGTTLGYLAQLLVSAGAGRVEAVVASRTARRPEC